MLFYEPLFLFLFFPVVLTAFLVTQHSAGARAAVLLTASVSFYLWSEPRFVPVVMATCWAEYRLSSWIHARFRPGLWLAVGVLINVAVLVYYKYTNFAVDNLDVLLVHWGLQPLHLLRIALPIGVSFITFEKITYLVDIYRQRSHPAPTFSRYLLYVFLFPKLLAGPIIKYHELEAQIVASGRLRLSDLTIGFRRFMLGVVKKTILADTLAGGADSIFGTDMTRLSFTDAWWGVIFFTFQIYIDFSAYSDMAIGLARIFGYRLTENFNRPYISCSITEFWRRWHISLSSWVREYLYIPLGGNRVAAWRRYTNLWLCFLASGLWHGAAWTYVVWGAYNGLFLVADRLFLLRVLDRMPRIAANGITFLITVVGWTLFRAATLGQAGGFLTVMTQFGSIGAPATVWRTTPMMVAAAAAALISFLPRVPGFDWAALWIMARPLGRFMVELALSLLFVFALTKALAEPFKPFLYFRF